MCVNILENFITPSAPISVNALQPHNRDGVTHMKTVRR